VSSTWLCAVSPTIQLPKNERADHGWTHRTANSPPGVGVADAPMTTRDRSTRRPPRSSVSDRLARETVIRHAVGFRPTRSALTQPDASLGRHGSRTRTQQRPRASSAARVTSSQEASAGRTTRTGRRPLLGNLACTGAGRAIRARQASERVGRPTSVLVA
jgi:hypothetical protein